jgi:mono/diheme cytochrome c family protein
MVNSEDQMKTIRTALSGCASIALLAGLMMMAAPEPLLADNAAIRPAYDKMCATCHGKDGSADTTMGKKMNVRPFSHPDVKKMTDAQLTEVTAKGKGKMPGYEKKLSAEQIKQMVKLVRDMGK